MEGYPYNGGVTPAEIMDKNKLISAVDRIPCVPIGGVWADTIEACQQILQAFQKHQKLLAQFPAWDSFKAALKKERMDGFTDEEIEYIATDIYNFVNYASSSQMFAFSVLKKLAKEMEADFSFM